MGGSTTTNNSTSCTKPPPCVLQAYQNAVARMNEAANQPFVAYGNSPEAYVAGLSGSQKAGMQNINNLVGSANPAVEASQNYFMGNHCVNPNAVLPTVKCYQNPYTQCVINATMRAMNQQNQQQASNLQGCAIMRGAYGGCRAGIAQANLAYQQNLAQQQTLAGLYCKNYTQALAAATGQQGICLAAQQANRQAQQLGASTSANLGLQNEAQQLAASGQQMQAGLACQQTQQAGKTAMYNCFQQQQGYPFQTASAVANTAEATGAASGSKSTSTGTSNTSSGFASGGSVGRPSKYYGGGLGASHQGGAVVSEAKCGGRKALADGGCTNGFNPAGFTPVMGDCNVIHYQGPCGVSYTSAQMASMTGAPPCITALKGGANRTYNAGLFQEPGNTTTNQYGMASGNAPPQAGGKFPSTTPASNRAGASNPGSAPPQATGKGSAAYSQPTANQYGSQSTLGTGNSAPGQCAYGQFQQQQQNAVPQAGGKFPTSPAYNGPQTSMQPPQANVMGTQPATQSASFAPQALVGTPSCQANAANTQSALGNIASAAPQQATQTTQAQGTYSGGATGLSGNWACHPSAPAGGASNTVQAKPFAHGGRAGFALAGSVGCGSQSWMDRAGRMGLGAANPYAPNTGAGYASNIPQQYVPRYGLQAPAVNMTGAGGKRTGISCLLNIPQQLCSATTALGKLKTGAKEAYSNLTKPAEPATVDAEKKANGGRAGLAGGGIGYGVPCCCSYVTGINGTKGYNGQPYGAVAKGAAPNSKCGYVMPGLAKNPTSPIQPLKSGAPAAAPAGPPPSSPVQTAIKLASGANTVASLPGNISAGASKLSGLFGGATGVNAADTATLDAALGKGFTADNISLGGAGAAAAPEAATGAIPSAIDLTTAPAGLSSIGASAAAPAVADAAGGGLAAAGGAAIPEAVGKGASAAAVPEAAGKMALAARNGGAIKGYAYGGRTGFANGSDADPSDAPPPAPSDAPPPAKPSMDDMLADFTNRTIARESRGRPDARATTSSASGLGGVINSTARGWLDQNGVSYDPRASHIAATLDPDTQMAMTRDLVKGHLDVLDKHGLEPSYGNVTMTHFLGDAGGPAFIKNMQKNPDAPATSFVSPAAARANQSIFFKNNEPRSAQEVYSLLANAGQGRSGSASAYAGSQPSAGGAAMDAINSIMKGGKEAAGGIGDAASGLGDWFGQNKSWILPILSGLGSAGQAAGQGMRAGSSILAGIGGAANSYGNMALQQSQITKNNMDLFNQNIMHTKDKDGKDIWQDRFGNTLSPEQVTKMWSSITGSNPALKSISGTPSPIVPANATKTQVEAAKGDTAPAAPAGGTASAAPAPQTVLPVKLDKNGDVVATPSTGEQYLTTEVGKVRQQILSDPKWTQDPDLKGDLNNNPKLLFDRANMFQAEAEKFLKIAEANAPLSGTSPAANATYENAKANSAQYRQQADAAKAQGNKLVDQIAQPTINQLTDVAKDRQAAAKEMDKAMADGRSTAYSDMNIQKNLTDVLENHKFGPGSELYMNLYSKFAAVPGVVALKSFYDDHKGEDWMTAGQDLQKQAAQLTIEAVRQTGGQRAPAAIAEYASKTIPGAEMSPGASYDMIANRKAASLAQKAMANDWFKEDRIHQLPDAGRWQTEWLENHKLDDFKQQAKLSMPMFKGMSDHDILQFGPRISDPQQIKALHPNAEFVFDAGPDKGKIGYILPNGKLGVR